MSRAEGGAGTSRADAPLVWECGISLRNCSDVKSRVPYTSATWEGRACRGRALRRPRPTPHPRPNPQPPTHGPACEVPEPPSARGVRTGLPRWLALTHEDPDIGRGARPARPPAPHAHARLGCWTPRRAPRRGRAAGDVGPYHCPARTHLASTILPPAPTRPRRWLYNVPAREVPAPPSARGVHSLPPHASTPCASRAPRNFPQKSEFFLSSKDAGGIHSCVGLRADMRRAQ